MRAAFCLPAARDLERPVELIKHAVVAVDDDDVAVAVAIAAALDRSIIGDREGAWVAFIAVGGVGDRNHGLAATDDAVGDAVGRPVPNGAETGVQLAVGADGADKSG